MRRIPVLAVIAILVAGCTEVDDTAPSRPVASATPSATPSPTPSPTPRPKATARKRRGRIRIVAHARVPRVRVFRTRKADRPFVRLENPTENGGPLVFLVRRERGRWLQVLLPIRPNGTKGWIPTSKVRLFRHRFHIRVELEAHRVIVFKGKRPVMKVPIGVGTGDTPTPRGRFYIKELLRPPPGVTAYGPFAYGLSGFSNKLTSFAGGPGVIGLHGTNDPSSIGNDVSHGCIRLYNRDIRRLVRFIPLGTPVLIVRRARRERE